MQSSMMTLASLFKINKKAFTAILVGSIMAIMIGAILLVVTYVLLSPIFQAAINTQIATGAMNASGVPQNNTFATGMDGSFTVITQALTITGISLIVAGVAGIIYMLMGVAGMTGGARGR